MGIFPVIALNAFLSATAFANLPPVVDAFTANPATPTPGRVVTLTLNAHDPDCAATCTSGCGTYIRSDLFPAGWSDNTGRAASAVFLNSVTSPSGSPWSATVEWVAPATEGSYVVSAYVADSGGTFCGGRLSTTATLTITVSTSAPPVIDSFIVSPVTVPVGGTAQLSVVAHDPAGGSLSYAFSADAGTIQQSSPSSTTAQWTAPLSAGVVNLRCAVSAAAGPPVTAQTSVQVVLGSFSGWLPLNGGRATRVCGLLDGRLAVVDGVGGTVSAISAAGSVSWSVPGFAEPIAVASAASEIYVLERKAGRIAVLSTAGAALRTVSCPGQSPAGLAAGPGAGELTVSDGAGGRLYVIAADTGALRRTMGEGILKFPAGVACSQGKVAVADTGLRRVVLFDGSGVVLSTMGDDTLFVRPQGVTWDPMAGRLVVSDSFSSELTVMGEDGSVRGQLAGFGSGAGQISAPVDVQLVAGGLLAVPLALSGEVALFQLLFSLAPPAPATGVSAGDVVGDNGGAIMVSWTRSVDDPARVVSYRIERAFDPTGNFSARTWVPAGSTSTADQGTIDGQCYVYRVVASDGVLESASPVTPCAYSKNDQPPPAPAFVTVQPESPTTAVVAWAPVSAPDLASYSLTLAGSEGTRSWAAPAGSAQTSLTALLPGGSYQLSVAAVDTAGNVSAPAQASFSTYPDEPPPVPVGVTATDTKRGGEIEVAWTAPPGPVPAASFKVTATPQVAGWPVVEVSPAQSPQKLTGLVNKLPYLVSVTAFAPWGRESAPSAPVAATPTAPPRDLAVVPEVGWAGGSPGPDASGIVVRIPPQTEERLLKLEYRADGSQLGLLLDGVSVSSPLPDTLNAWTGASLNLSAKELGGTTAHLLELRNAGFPSPAAVLSLRNVDLLPLPVERFSSAPFNTVIDLTWTPSENRPDLLVTVARKTEQNTLTPVPCTAPSLARCRDTFVPNDSERPYRAIVVSPAGWQSEPREGEGKASYSDGPPPVTDLLVASDGTSWTLRWTPLSTALSKKADPTPVSSYRIYRQDARGLTFLVEVLAPPASLPLGALDPATSRAIVRSVDASGMESP